MARFHRRQSNVQQGWYIVGGKKCFFRSALERRWASLLELCKRFKELSEFIFDGRVLQEWYYEPKTFYFYGPEVRDKGLKGKSNGVRDYLPDFCVEFAGRNLIEYHECKGYLGKADKVKLSCFAKYYPEITLVVVVDGIPKGKTIKSRNKRIALKKATIEKGHKLIDARPYFKHSSLGPLIKRTNMKTTRFFDK